MWVWCSCLVGQSGVSQWRGASINWTQIDTIGLIAASLSMVEAVFHAPMSIHMRTSCEVPKRQRCVSVKVSLTDGRVHHRDAWKCREGFLAMLTRVVVVVLCCLAFEWDVCRRLLLNRGFIKINGFRCKRSRRWKTDCACEGQREHLSRRVLSTMVCVCLFVCVSVK